MQNDRGGGKFGSPRHPLSVRYPQLDDTHRPFMCLQQRGDERMLGTACRYLVVVIVLGVGFGLIADPALWRSGQHDEAEARGHRSQDAAESAGEGETWEDREGEDDWDEDHEDESSAVPLEMVIPAGAHGHFMVEAVVEGTPLIFVVDTGASDVILSPADAKRLGFRTDELRFTRRYQTANGAVAAAPVTLRELRIGQFSAFDVEASVNGAPLPVSLLGMSFLRRLRGYEVDDGRLILRW
jgi:clan AA aspartic protease (TIGR02281 family)